MAQIWKGLLALSAIAGAFACHPGTDAERGSIGTDSREIIGGVDDPDDPAVVALFIHREGEGSGALCTATLISPTVLLTAGHCVHPYYIQDRNVFTALFGPTLSSAQRVDVAETHYDPAFNPPFVTSGHDVAVAILAQPVAIDPIPYNHDPMTPDMINQPVRLIGYGLSDPRDPSTAGTKRQVTTVLRQINQNTIQVGTRTEQNCEGDSGGPALMDFGAGETIVGTTSFGVFNCSGNGGWDMRVDVVSDFVDSYVAGP